MEEIIIDGCNLAYKAFGGSGRGERGQLLRAVASRYCGKRVTVTVVFDSREGGDRELLLPNVAVRYAPSPADDYIVSRVTESNRRGAITVITDDRSVGASVRSLGAKHVRSSDFLAALKARTHPSEPNPQDTQPVESEEGIRRYLDLWEEREK